MTNTVVFACTTTREGRQLADRLKALGETTYIYEGAVTRGYILNNAGEALFVDSGLEPRNGRQLVRAAQEQHWVPRGVLTTHAHADHFGGHRAIVDACQCNVYASRLARPILEYPLWEAIMLHSTARPPVALCDKFFVAQAVRVDAVVGENEPLPRALQEWDLAVFDLPGHSHGMTAFGADGVLFCGDAFLEPRLIRKHGLPALVDVAAMFNSLDRLRELSQSFQWVVASHGGAYQGQRLHDSLVANRSFIERSAQFTLDCLVRPMLIDELVREVARSMKRPPMRFGELALYRMTVSAFLSYLENEGLVKAERSEPVSLWRRV